MELRAPPEQRGDHTKLEQRKNISYFPRLFFFFFFLMKVLLRTSFVLKRGKRYRQCEDHM